MTTFFVAKFKKANKCHNCPSTTYNGRTLCSEHLAKARMYWRTWTVERRKDGRCYYCNRKSINGWLRCKHHTKINRERIRIWMQKHPEHNSKQWLLTKELRNKGICTCRARNPLIPGDFRCAPCAARGVGRRRVKRTK